MMDTTKDLIIGIEQAEAFSCIGSACPDTCCAGWSIPVDRFTLEKWESDPLYHSKVKKHLTIINNENPQNINAANIEATNDGACPFLDKEKLCELHKEKGHEFLSFTCRTFPRSRNAFFGIQEEYLSLACPEAARMLLSPESKLSIKVLDNAHSELPVFQYNIREAQHGSVDIAWELRTLVYGLIQIEAIPLSHRLIIIGLMTKNIEEELAKGVETQCAYKEVTEKYKSLLSSTSYISQLVKDIPVSYDLKIIFLKTISHVISKYTFVNKGYKKYYDILEDTYKIKVKISDQDLINHYKQIQTHIPVRTQKILENYTYHLFFRELFPFSQTNLSEHFNSLVFRIYLITHHLAAIKDRSEENQIELIQKFSKLYENTPLLQHAIASITKSANFDSIAHACILINDR